MDVVIIGAGSVGSNIANKLVKEEYDVTIVDRDQDKVATLKDTLDAQVVLGDGSSPRVLRDVGVSRASLFVAVTDDDRTNMIATLVGRSMNDKLVKIARIRDPEFVYDSRILGPQFLDIDLHINPEIEAAEEIVRLLEYPQVNHLKEFMNGRMRLVGLRITKEHRIVERQIAEMGKEFKEHGFLAAAIMRGTKIIIPRGETTVEVGDELFVLVQTSSAAKALQSLGVPSEDVKRVMLLGGGNIGRYLAHRLEAKGLAVKLVEKDLSVCERLSEELRRTVILHGDASERELLQEENIADMHAFIATTRDEELNILACLLAKQMGVHRVISITSKVGYQPLTAELGVDVAISPRGAAINQILQFIRKGRVVSVAQIGEEEAEAIEFEIGDDSPIVNTPLHLLNLPSGVVIGAIERKGKVTVAGGDDTIHPGDRIVAFALGSSIPELEKTVTG
ncbi:Trk system potassium transporter TrkA [Bdellovibrionota bacterium]